jgi:integrase
MSKRSGGDDGFFLRGRIWWIRTDPITGKQVSTKAKTRAQRDAWYDTRYRQSVDPSYQPPSAKDATLNGWAVRFVEHKAATKSVATASFYGKKLGHMVRILGADTPISNALRPANFDAYVIQRKSEGVRNTTIRKEIRAAQTMARLAARAGDYHGRPELLMPSDLTDDYEPGERFLAPEELPLLLPELEPHRAAWVALEVALGSRFAETQRALKEDIDTDTWLVRVRGSKTRRSKAVIPIASPFRPLLLLAIPHLPLQPWANMTRDLERACARAKIPKVTSNDLRRTHGSWLVEAGVSGTVGARVLRNTEIVFNRVYGRARPEQLLRLMDAQMSATIPQHLAARNEASSAETSTNPSDSQEVDMRIENPRVGGSIPSRDTEETLGFHVDTTGEEVQGVSPADAVSRNVRNDSATVGDDEEDGCPDCGEGDCTPALRGGAGCLRRQAQRGEVAPSWLASFDQPAIDGTLTATPEA